MPEEWLQTKIYRHSHALSRNRAAPSLLDREPVATPADDSAGVVHNLQTQASVATPLESTTTSRSTTRERNSTRLPSRYISVRMVSPG
jgi:hypothetical protein